MGELVDRPDDARHCRVDGAGAANALLRDRDSGGGRGGFRRAALRCRIRPVVLRRSRRRNTGPPRSAISPRSVWCNQFQRLHHPLRRRIAYAGRLIYEGRLRRRGLFLVWGAEIAMSTAFGEVIGTGTDVYTYYGPYVGRIVNYPVVIGVLEERRRCSSRCWRCCCGARFRRPGDCSACSCCSDDLLRREFRPRCPVIIALHLDDGLSTDGLVAAATILSIALCAFAVYGLAGCCRTPRRTTHWLLTRSARGRTGPFDDRAIWTAVVPFGHSERKCWTSASH